MLRKSLWVGVLTMSLVWGPQARAQSSKQMDSASVQSKVFLLTATYGVVSGTLTGLGSLAFYDSPSSHSRNVAMGASIGLYVGILLGAYMTYGGSDSSPSTGPGSPKGGAPSGKVGEDPLRLGVAEPVVPMWSPYFAFNEKQKSMIVGVSYLY